MNLFALTNNSMRRILRLPLSQNIQIEVRALFTIQETQFKALAQEFHDFDGKYKPDDNECLVIKEYDDIDNIHDAVANPLGVPEIQSDFDEFSSIKSLFSGYTADDGSSVALFQNFDRRKIISPQGMSLFHTDNVYKKVDGVGLTLDDKLSAILIDKSIQFFSFHNVRKVFDLSQYYVEATNSDLNDFSSLASIHIDNKDEFLAIADSWIRRKVSLISQSKILENVEIDTIVETAKMFNIEIGIIERESGAKAIIMPKIKAEIKKLLRFLDEDYFQSSLQQKPFISNSRRPAHMG
jgi:hypothetical protein